MEAVLSMTLLIDRKAQRVRFVEPGCGGAKLGRRVVQGIVKYTVLDDLTVTPMSTISGITLLNTFAVKDLGDLQEKNVQLGYNEGLAILKASLQSKTVLTDVLQGGVRERSCHSFSCFERHYWSKREWLTYG